MTIPKIALLLATTVVAMVGLDAGRQLATASRVPSAGGGGNICPKNYSVTTFATGPFTADNIDLQSTFRSGFQWYRWRWFSGSNGLDQMTLNPDGSLTVSGVSGPNGQMTTGAMTDTAPYFVGKAFGGGLCTEAEVSFNPKEIDVQKGFPAYWAMPLEHLNQRAGGARMPGQVNDFERFVELDFMEVYKYPLPQYLGSAIDWFGQYRKSCSGKAFCAVAQSFANTFDAIPSDTDWTKWHRIGAVWQPAEQGRLGSLQYFFDGRPLAPPFIWKAGGNREALPIKGGQTLFNALDRQHLVLLLGSNSAPLKVRSVWVRQRDGSHNLAN